MACLWGETDCNFGDKMIFVALKGCQGCRVLQRSDGYGCWISRYAKIDTEFRKSTDDQKRPCPTYLSYIPYLDKWIISPPGWPDQMTHLPTFFFFSFFVCVFFIITDPVFLFNDSAGAYCGRSSGPARGDARSRKLQGKQTLRLLSWGYLHKAGSIFALGRALLGNFCAYGIYLHILCRSNSEVVVCFEWRLETGTG